MQTCRPFRLSFPPVPPPLDFSFHFYSNREQQESVKKRRFPFRISVPKPAKITITPFHFWIATKKIILPQPTSTRALSISLLPPRYVISPTPLPTIVPLHCSAPTNECAIRRRQPLPPPVHPPPPALSSPANLPKLAPPTDLPPPALPPLAA